MPHQTGLVRCIRHVRRLVETDSQPIGNGRHHEAAQDLAAGQRIDGKAHNVGLGTGDGHGAIGSMQPAGLPCCEWQLAPRERQAWADRANEKSTEEATTAGVWALPQSVWPFLIDSRGAAQRLRMPLGR
jgi:hypothetical protein